MTAKALGYLRRDKSADPQGDAQTIQDLADRVGYTLVETLTPGAEIEPDPATWLLARVHGHRAAAVVIAAQRHMPPPMVDVMTTVCSVVGPDRIIPGHVQYPQG
ncbi:hypothetical protein [Nocardia asiatica]